MKYFTPTLLPRNKWFQTRDIVKIGNLVLELNQTSQTVTVGDGANYQRLPWQRQFGQEGANQDQKWRVRPANP